MINDNHIVMIHKKLSDKWPRVKRIILTYGYVQTLIIKTSLISIKHLEKATPKQFKFDSDQAYLRMQKTSKRYWSKSFNSKSSFNYYTLYKIAAVAILVIAVYL